MKKLTCDPGVCGYIAHITADAPDGEAVTITVQSGCKGVAAMGEALAQMPDAYDLCLHKAGEGPVWQAARTCPHAACPVPVALVKCVEAECGLALPKNASIAFTQ